jgi:hypothetical protein
MGRAGPVLQGIRSALGAKGSEQFCVTAKRKSRADHSNAGASHHRSMSITSRKRFFLLIKSFTVVDP